MAVLLIIQLICSAIALCLKGVGKLRCSGAALFMAILVPVFGFLCLASILLARGREADRAAVPDLEQKRIEDEIFQSIPGAPDVDAKRIVPISESLVLNSPLQRRQLLLILNRDPASFVPQLRQAGRNEDTEVVHYAVTALVELRREFSNQLALRERELREAPEDVETLEAYAELEKRYLDSGLPEGGERVERLLHYQTLLRRIQDSVEQEMEPDRGRVLSLMEKRVRVAMRLQDDQEVDFLIGRIISLFPEEESGYLLQMDCCAARRDRKGIDMAIRQLREREMPLSSAGERAVRFWCGQVS